MNKWFKDKNELEESFKDLKPLLEYFTQEELKGWTESNSNELKYTKSIIKNGKIISK